MYASRIVSFKKIYFNKIYQIKSMVNYHENLITVHIKKNQYVEPLKMLGEFIETD